MTQRHPGLTLVTVLAAMLAWSVPVGAAEGTPDTTPPIVEAFSLQPTSDSLTVPVLGLAASDDVGVTGYQITETDLPPDAAGTGWTPFPPGGHTFLEPGERTLWAWAVDASGNVSAGVPATTTIVFTPPPPDTVPPTVEAFELPTTADSLEVSIVALSAADNAGVGGYLLTETDTPPDASGTGWSAAAPGSYVFAVEGPRTLWAWAKDAAGNVSAGRSATVTITLPPPLPDTPLFVESFTDAAPDGDPDWETAAGAFGGVRGSFLALATGRNLSLASSPAGLAPFAGGRIEAWVRYINPVPRTTAEIVFDYQDDAHYRFVRVDRRLRRLVIGQVGDFEGDFGGSSLSVGLPALAFRTGRWHHLRLDIDPSTGAVSAFVEQNAAPALTVTYARTGVGRVGVAASNARRKVAFDNVEIRDTSVLP